MAFPTDLTAVLTGASLGQLRRWNTTGLFKPEIATEPRLLYSFRDLVAVRTVVRLRAATSLQKVRRAFDNMSTLDFTEHPSQYRFGTDGKTIAIADSDGNIVNLVKNPGQYEIISLAEVFKPFRNKQGADVVDFLHPRKNLEVRASRMGGWPIVVNTRIPYNTIAQLVANGEVRLDEVDYYYPGVSVDAARDALDFDAAVRDVG